MFNNIGSKIKLIAKITTWIGIILSIIVGNIAMASYEDLILSGLLIMILGSAFSWLGSLMFYGFGELIERVTSIDYVLNAKQKETDDDEGKTTSLQLGTNKV